MPRELVASEQPGGHDAEDGVQRHRDQRDRDGEEERVLGRRRGHGVPGGGEAVLERAVEDHPHRDDEQRGQVEERHAPQRDPAPHLHDPPARHERDDQQHQERDDQQQHRHRGGAVRVAALDLAVDQDRGDLGLVRQVAADQHDRAELADRAPEGEPDAGQHRRPQGRQDDAAEDRPRLGAERLGGLLGLALEAHQHGLDRAHHERQRHEQQREHDRDPRVGDVDADRPARPVEREQDEAGHDRRQRERQVDQPVDDPLAGELVADEHPGDHRPDDGVDGRHDQRDDQRQPDGGLRLRARDGVPERRHAAVERLHDDGGERDQDDQRQPGDGVGAREQRRSVDPGPAAREPPGGGCASRQWRPPDRARSRPRSPSRGRRTWR